MAEESKRLRQGTKGLAGRILKQPPVGRATTRSALQRVGRQTGRERPPPEAKAEATKRSGRAAQAALGMMGRRPADFDEDTLRAWLKGMNEAELKRLSKLVWAARQGDQAAPSSAQKPPFEGVARHLAGQGMQFSINAQTVIVNVGEASAARQSYQPRPRRKEYQGDWGRSWGRVKDFINGH
jgi:hypothetical protein